MIEFIQYNAVQCDMTYFIVVLEQQKYKQHEFLIKRHKWGEKVEY